MCRAAREPGASTASDGRWMTTTRSAGVRERLTAGEQLVGVFMQLRDPAAYEWVGRLGFDVLCIEAEHSSVSIETMQLAATAAQLTPSATITRIAGNDPIAISTALDCGVQGIIVPRVSSAAEAAAAVAAARYPPAGSRGLGPSRATGYGADIARHLARANDELLLAIQIETADAVASLDDLLAVEGVDLCFVGPGDLACSLGLPLGGPEARAVVADVIGRTRAAGRLTGVWAGTPADAATWRAAGVDLVILGSDLMWLAAGVQSCLAGLREAAIGG
jgi:4-hydroxy-2-oxoheptanedioate aldolase